MVVVRRAVLLLALMLVLAGCGGKPKALPPPTTPSAGLGSIEGAVTDEEERPVPGAEVGLLSTEHKTLTDEMGKFTFNDVEPGAYDLAVGLLGYESFVQRVTVVIDEVAPVSVRLKAFEVPLEAVVDLQTFQGFLQCSYNPYYFVNPCGDALGDNIDHFRFDLRPDLALQQLLLELTWIPATAATSKELELDLCLPPEDAASAVTGCMASDVDGKFYVYESGVPPVVINLTAEDLPADARTYEAWIGNGIYSPYPSFQQAFTLYVTTCYVAACPAGTTGLPPPA